MGMVAILFNSAEPTEQTGTTHLTEGSMRNLVKIAKAISEKKILKQKNKKQFYTCI